MKVSIKVIAKDESHFYIANIDTQDPRQVWNEVRKGRNAVGPMNVSTVHLEGDKSPFRVGLEKDTVEWLKTRLRNWLCRKEN